METIFEVSDAGSVRRSIVRLIEQLSPGGAIVVNVVDAVGPGSDVPMETVER